MSHAIRIGGTRGLLVFTATMGIALLAGVAGSSADYHGGSQSDAADAYQTSKFKLSQHRPGRPTAERFLFDYQDPADPDAKPPAVKRVVTVLPRGGRYDPRVPDSCTASDAEFMAMGAAACPPDSAIGGGVITVDTGFPGPGRFVTADTEFFNNAEDPNGEFIYLNTVRDNGARTVVRADVTRRRTITEAPFLPGTPAEGGAIDTVDVEVAKVSEKVDGERHGYVTTPRRCPPDRDWTAKVRFSYDDGTQVVRTKNRCRDGNA